MVTGMTDRHHPQEYKDRNHLHQRMQQENKHPGKEQVVERVSVIQKLKYVTKRPKHSDFYPDATLIDIPKATTDYPSVQPGDLFLNNPAKFCYTFECY